MPMPRTPLEKAKATGAFKANPKRFKDRTRSPSSAPLGTPSDWLEGEQRIVWEMFRGELPWLKESHRGLVEIACTVRARLTSGEDVGVQALNLLRQCLGQMGGTPADESKVRVPDEGEADPAESYFH